jgi:hypothetical protein
MLKNSPALVDFLLIWLGPPSGLWDVSALPIEVSRIYV